MAKGDRSNKISIVFDSDRCLHARTVKSSCSSCIDTCPTEAIRKSDKRGMPEIDPTICVNCGQCLSACHLDAFSSPQFTERQLINRIDRGKPLRLRCFLPYGELDELDLNCDTYHLGTCIGALTAGGLFELSLANRCELATDRCRKCVLFPRLAPTMEANVKAASQLLADWDRASNLVESTPLFLTDQTAADQPENAPADTRSRYGRESALSNEQTLSADDVAAFTHLKDGSGTQNNDDAADAVGAFNDVRSSIRLLFHGRRKRESGGLMPRPELRVRRYKNKHVPLWRDRLQALWRHSESVQGGHYLWPEHIVDKSICRACGVCMQMCPTGSIHHTLGDGEFVYEFSPGTCVNCGVCVASCPKEAIKHRAQALMQPFYLQECYAMKAEPCPRCGLPVLERDDGPLCCVCNDQPKTRDMMRQLGDKLGAGVSCAPVGDFAPEKGGGPC